ncbi:MAG TPA: outer membrane lipoprotein carrier protein LolA [Dongiaceae bacterium]|nr:outer membrane lipoprotein carrier protein LolA [Dongiaceae bacterium]
MKKLIALGLCGLLGLAMVTGQTARADDTLSLARLKPGSVLRGHFIQERSLQGFQAPLKSEGSFVVAEGKGLIWRVEKPFATVTVITPAGLVQNAQGTETLRLPADRIPFIARFYEMLSGTMTGDLNGLTQQFDVKKSGTAADWSLQLTPKSAAGSSSADAQNMPIQRLDLAGDQYVKSVDIQRQNGDRDQLTFLDQHLDAQPLSAEETALLAGAGDK